VLNPLWDGRPHARAAARLLAAGVAVAAVCVAASAVGGAAAKGTYPLAKTSVPLRIDQQRLGPWKPLVLREGAYVGFTSHGAPADRVLKLSDHPDRAGYVAVSAALTPTPRVVVSAEVNLVRQSLRRGKVRALLAVAGADGNTYQAGVLRARSGRLTWALWRKTPEGLNTVIQKGGTATLRTWHRIVLQSVWAGPQAQATLAVDKRRLAQTPPRAATAVPARRVILGLGRTSKETETGVFLVRSARVRSTNPVPIRGAVAAPPPKQAPGLGPTGQLPGKELKRADFETGDLRQWSAIHRVAEDRLTVVQSPVRQGRYAGRFDVRNGDNPIGYGDRSQVTLSTGEREGQERWYGFSTMLAPDFPRVGNWQVLAQWHSDANGSPPLAVFAENDDLVLRAHRTSSPGSVLSIEDLWRGPMRRGQWQDLVFRIKWSGSDSVGFVEMWVDGKPQVLDGGSTRRYVRTMYPGYGNYFVMCYYRQSGVAQPGVVYHDDFRMSDGGI
jgi:hypothetical protein